MTGLTRITRHARGPKSSFRRLDSLSLSSRIIVRPRRRCTLGLNLPKSQLHLIPTFLLNLLKDRKQLQLCNNLIGFILHPILKNIVLVVLLDYPIVSKQLLELSEETAVLCRHFWALVHV